MGCSGSKGTKVDDKNKPTDGDQTYVTVEEAEAYVKKELGLEDEQAKRLVANVDKNGDGKVAEKELEQLCKDINEVLAEFRAKFEATCEGDDKEYVTKEKAQEVIKAYIPAFPEARLAVVVCKFDKDGDDKFNFKEFCFFYAYLKIRRSQLEAAFNEVDADDSGKLSEEEVVKAVESNTCYNEAQARCLIEGHDFNKDGKIDKAEFISMWETLFPATA